MADKTLNGKVALVTGASSGMGRGIALGLADRGVSVICYDLKPEANPTGFEKDLGITTSDMINKQGGQTVFFEVDISQPSQIEHAFNEAIAVGQSPRNNSQGPIDALIQY
jgi:NAD(P)-dependent dehydrogenase (short-subunit alcohol dehydrogenase family)